VDRANARRVRRVLQGLLPAGAAVLEIGPGHGALLAALAAARFRVEGLELSPAVAEATSRRSGVPVRVATLERHAGQAAGGYGGIVARHVLEHMSDPRAAVDALHTLLAPGGVVYVAVPNIAAPQAALPGWTGYQPYHLHYFTPARLDRLFERAGFERLGLRTREPFSGWVNAIVNSARSTPGGAPSRGRPRGAVVTAYNVARLLAGAALTPLRLLQGWSGRGEEIELVARKGMPA
jgi:SAM-dependent methyltransferase